MAGTSEVRRDDERSRYELVVDGAVVGIAEFRERGDDVELPHTVIDPAHRGRGHGAVLVRGTLDDLRRRGTRIIPTCWFVREFVDMHPDYRDLLAEQ